MEFSGSVWNKFNTNQILLSGIAYGQNLIAGQISIVQNAELRILRYIFLFSYSQVESSCWSQRVFQIVLTVSQILRSGNILWKPQRILDFFFQYLTLKSGLNTAPQQRHYYLFVCTFFFCSLRCRIQEELCKISIMELFPVCKFSLCCEIQLTGYLKFLSLNSRF